MIKQTSDIFAVLKRNNKSAFNGLFFCARSLRVDDESIYTRFDDKLLSFTNILALQLERTDESMNGREFLRQGLSALPLPSHMASPDKFAA